MIASLMLLGAAATGQASASPVPREVDLVCQATLPEIGGRQYAWVNVVGRGDNWYREVVWRGEGFEATWSVDGDGYPIHGSLHDFAYELPVPADTRFPATIAIAIDARERASAVAAGPTTVSSLAGDGSPAQSSVRIVVTAMPEILGGRTLAFRIAAMRYRHAVVLPDWRRFRRETRRALAVAIADRRRGRCGPGTIP